MLTSAHTVYTVYTSRRSASDARWLNGNGKALVRKRLVISAYRYSLLPYALSNRPKQLQISSLNAEHNEDNKWKDGDQAAWFRRLGEIHAFDGLHRLSKNLWAALSGIQTLDAKNVFLILNDFNSFNLSLKKSSLIKKSLIRIFIILFDQTVWVASIPATENLRESWKQNWSKQLSNDRSRCIFKVKIV